MLLSAAYEELLRINLSIRSDASKGIYRLMLGQFAEYLGEEPTISHLTDDHHSGFARWMLDSGTKVEQTINQRLSRLRALWRFCAKRGYVTVWPTSAGIPEPDQQPSAWTDEDLAKLWAAFDKVPGDFFGVRKSLWWRAFHEVIYWTGERKGAVLDAEWSWLRDGRLNVPAKSRKGKRKPKSYWLPESALDSIEAIREPERKKIFPTFRYAKTFYRHYHRLLRIAGIDGPRRGPQQMRRTHASMLVRAGGDATKSLGHSTSRITEQYYLDPTITETQPANAILPGTPGA